MTAVHRARLAGWLDLAARGWFLFPVRPSGKAPAIRGWQERATTDPDRINRFFTTHPDHNAGIACGPSGLLVIDCDMPKTTDPRHQERWCRGDPAWPTVGADSRHLDVTTPSGEGTCT